jgi:large subunit ribosomal protein L9
MKNVEILLRDRVEHLGHCGDVVRVAPGFARNYLFPSGLAVAATPENKRLMDRRRDRLDAEDAARAAELDAVVARLNGVTVKTSGKAEESGSLYGSVNAAKIAELLTAAGHSVEEKSVRLDAPLKTVGEHNVRVHVYADAYAEVRVQIVAEE